MDGKNNEELEQLLRDVNNETIVARLDELIEQVKRMQDILDS